MFDVLTKSIVLHVCAARHVFIIWGNKNNTPDCKPLPRPMLDIIPRPIHLYRNIFDNISDFDLFIEYDVKISLEYKFKLGVYQ